MEKKASACAAAVSSLTLSSIMSCLRCGDVEKKAGAAVDGKTFNQICVESEVLEMARKRPENARKRPAKSRTGQINSRKHRKEKGTQKRTARSPGIDQI